MDNYSKKTATFIAVLFVFMTIVGLASAVHHWLLVFGPKVDLFASLAIVVIGAGFIARNRGRNRAKECAVNMGLMYVSLFLEPIMGVVCFAIGMGLYIFEWVCWDKRYRNGSVGCYCRWMTYSISVLSFLLAGNLVLLYKHLVFPAIPVSLSVLWLVMIFRLSLKLRH